jgi:Protein of unknown function (DUF3040)
MALSMEEQRILDAMERGLAGDDPRLASRLAGFGQPRLPGLAGSGRARAVFVLLSLALAALVTLMIYQMRPLPAAPGRPAHPAQRARVVTSPSSRAAASSPAARSAATSASAQPAP